MAGISHNAKNSNLPEFGDSVSAASKALCGLTEGAAQVRRSRSCLVYISAYVSAQGIIVVRSDEGGTES